jgi:hypothetical protein
MFDIELFCIFAMLSGRNLKKLFNPHFQKAVHGFREWGFLFYINLL